MSKPTRNLGKITISREDVYDTPQHFVEAFHACKFMPFRTEENMVADNITYIGVSPYFDEVCLGMEIPAYSITISRPARGPFLYEVVKL